MSSIASTAQSTVWVQAVVSDDAIAVPAFQIREMVTLDDAVAKPLATGQVRGLLNLRGRLLTLFDLRVLLGRRSATAELEELCAMLVQRKHDHEAWLDALLLSIKDGCPFTKARDPQQCAFGKWYSSYRTENAVLRMQLAKLDAPHRAIHALADETLAMAAAGNETAAVSRIACARRGLLMHLLQLLDECVTVLRDEHREIVLVIDRPGPGLGIVVDSVVGVRRIEPGDVEEICKGTLGEIERALLGMSKIEDRTHLLLDLGQFIDAECLTELTSNEAGVA